MGRAGVAPPVAEGSMIQNGQKLEQARVRGLQGESTAAQHDVLRGLANNNSKSPLFSSGGRLIHGLNRAQEAVYAAGLA